MKVLYCLSQQLNASTLLGCFLLASCYQAISVDESKRENSKAILQEIEKVSETFSHVMALSITTKPLPNLPQYSHTQRASQPALSAKGYPSTPQSNSTAKSAPYLGNHTVSKRLVLGHEQAGSTTTQATENNFEEDWNKLEINYDDSSDEEDTHAKVSAYSLADSIEKFKEHLSEAEPAIKKAKELKIDHFQNKYILSFITHAMGLQVLYGENVGAKYYPLKNKYLKQEIEEDLQEQMQEQIIKVIHDTIYKLIFNMGNPQIDKFYQPIIEVLVADFQKKYSMNMEILQKLILQKSRAILQHEEVEKLPIELQGEFKKLYSNILNYLTSLKDNDTAMQELFSNFPLTPFKSLPKTFKELEEDSNSILKNCLNNSAWQEAIKQSIMKQKEPLNIGKYIPTTGKISTMRSTKQAIKKDMEDQKCLDLTKIILQKLITANKGITEKKFFASYTERELLEIWFLLLQGAINQELKQSNSIIQGYKIKSNADIQNSRLRAFKDMLHEFIPITPRRIHELITYHNSQDVNKIIEISIKPLRAFLLKQERQTLPNFYEFDFETGYHTSTFLANLRLCNRSAKRLIKNYEPFQKDLLSKHKQSRACKFPASVDYALETQEITNLGNRTDLVINNGTYKDVYERFEKIKKMITNLMQENGLFKSPNNISVQSQDQDIAYWIQQTLQGKEFKQLKKHTKTRDLIQLNTFQLKEIKNIIADVAYLLFGTEVARNPAALLHHHMMLDLIAAGKFSWKKFLVEADGQAPMLPMQLEGAVQSARTLHMAYNKLTPYPYTYPKDEESIDNNKTINLISREGQLVYQWLKQCAKIEIDLSADITEGVQAEIAAAIEAACKKWFIFDIQQADPKKAEKSIKEFALPSNSTIKTPSAGTRKKLSVSWG